MNNVSSIIEYNLPVIGNPNPQSESLLSKISKVEFYDLKSQYNNSSFFSFRCDAPQTRYLRELDFARVDFYER